MHFDPRLFALTRGARPRILLAALLGLLESMAGVGRLAFAGLATANVLLGASLTEVAVPLLAMAGLVLLRAILHYLKEGIAHHTAMELKIQLRENMYAHALKLG